MKIETTTEKNFFDTEKENSARRSKVTYGLVKEVYAYLKRGLLKSSFSVLCNSDEKDFKTL